MPAGKASWFAGDIMTPLAIFSAYVYVEETSGDILGTPRFVYEMGA